MECGGLPPLLQGMRAIDRAAPGIDVDDRDAYLGG